MTITTDPRTLCPCGNPKQRQDWRLCLACAAEIDEQGMAELRAERDRLARWLPIAKGVLQPMDRSDPRYLQGKAVWDNRLRLYESLCLICPEFGGAGTVLEPVNAPEPKKNIIGRR